MTQKTRLNNRSLRQRLNYFRRGLTRAAMSPMLLLSEGPTKIWLRNVALNFQNSLPAEVFVNPGDNVVLIGTPWPKTLERFRKRIGADGRLIVIEAFPRNVQALRSAVEHYEYKNVTVFEGAAWNETKRGILLVSPYPGDHKIPQTDVVMDNDYRSGNESYQEIEVQLYRLDDILQNLGVGDIEFLSVTVNGAELMVLEGARRTLLLSKRIRVFSKGHALKNTGDPINRDIASYLDSLGFKTKITRGEPSSADIKSWKRRAGDVYAWRRCN